MTLPVGFAILLEFLNQTPEWVLSRPGEAAAVERANHCIGKWAISKGRAATRFGEGD
jgi:hypothetical protein